MALCMHGSVQRGVRTPLWQTGVMRRAVEEEESEDEELDEWRPRVTERTIQLRLTRVSK